MNCYSIKIVIIFLLAFLLTKFSFSQTSPYTVRWYEVSTDGTFAHQSDDSLATQKAIYDYLQSHYNPYWVGDTYGIHYSDGYVGIGTYSNESYPLNIYSESTNYLLKLEGDYGAGIYWKPHFVGNRELTTLFDNDGFHLGINGSEKFTIGYGTPVNAIYTSTNGVGILNNSPSYPLDVTGDIQLSGDIHIPNLQNIYGDVVTWDGSIFGWYNAYELITDSLHWIKNGSNLYTKSGITHIGVNTTPDEELTIQGVDNIFTKIHSTGSGSDAGFILQNDDVSWYFYNKGDYNNSFRIVDYTNSKIPFVIETKSPNFLVYLDSLGYVGIKKGTPAYTLDVAGFAYLDSTLIAPNVHDTMGNSFAMFDSNGKLVRRDTTGFNIGGTPTILDDLTDGYGIVDFTYNGSSTQDVIVDTSEIKSWVQSLIPEDDTCEWLKDAINDEIYPKALTTQVGIGTANPTEMLDVNGNINFPSTTSTIGRIKQNGQTILHTYPDANDNLFIGESSGNFTTTGNWNTAVGFSTLSNITSGFLNVAIGYGALSADTSGYYNIAIGNCLSSNKSGNQNIAIGAAALSGNTTGSDNVAVGLGALSSNTTGRYNTAIGGYALQNNVARERSVAVGYNAMFNANNSGSAGYTYNTAVGYEAMKGSGTPSANTGTYNTAIGYASLDAMTSGSYNVAVGESSLTALSSGSNNVGVGRNAMQGLTTGTSNVGIGVQALNSCNGSGNVGVGNNSFSTLNTTNASNTGVGTNSGSNVKTGSYNTAIGAFAMGNNSTGTRSASNNVAIGYGALEQDSTGNNNIAIGRNAGQNIESGANNIFIGYYAAQNIDSTASDILYIENSSSTTPLIYGNFSKDSLGFNGSISATLDSSNSRVYSVYYDKLTHLFAYDSAGTVGDDSCYFDRTGRFVYLKNIGDSLGIGTPTPTHKLSVKDNYDKVYLMGNSLTGASGQYGDTLQELLGNEWDVVWKGVSGNTTIQMLSRFQDDIIEPGDAAYVVILGGVNDIAGNTWEEGYRALDIQNRLQQMYTMAHNAGIKVVGLTVTPFCGDDGWPSCGTTAREIQDSVNTWIMNTAINIDYRINSFDSLEDPANPYILLPLYNSGDSIHLSEDGYNYLGYLVYDGVTWNHSSNKVLFDVEGSMMFNNYYSLGTPNGIEWNTNTTLSLLDAYIKHTPTSGELTISSGRNSTWGGHITMKTDTSLRMVIESGGDVGIGVANPSALLQVGTGIKLNADYTMTWGNEYGRLTWDTDKATILGGTGKALSLGTSGNPDKLFIDIGGQVGIGTAVPNELLEVDGNTKVNDTIFHTPYIATVDNDHDYFVIYDSSATAYGRMKLSSVAGDNLGNHSAEQDLDMNSYNIDEIDTASIENIFFTCSAQGENFRLEYNPNGEAIGSLDFITDESNESTIPFQISENAGDGLLYIHPTTVTVNETGGNNDFIAQGNTDVDLLTVDGSGDNVGIGLAVPTSKLAIDGSFAVPLTTVTSGTTLSALHHTIVVDNDTEPDATVSLTLPSASSCPGRIYIIKLYDTEGTSPVYGFTLVPDGLDVVAFSSAYGDVNYDFDLPGGSLTIQSDGTSTWYIIDWSDTRTTW